MSRITGSYATYSPNFAEIHR